MQALLIKLRKTILENAPNAKEDVICGMPVYKTKGKVLVCFSVENERTFVYFTPSRYAEYPTEITDPNHKNDSVCIKAGKPIQYHLIGQVINYWYKVYNQKVLI